ncbi:FMRFamide-activated amiloride-sensitive sodium channel [Araneus ventricosus]|uniref:FMRFamide-activated amiloride-sensitive sodium channel n=1 Tax=Araneus ventricosus TaxID=182803 RepID=A0A4Y2DS24_ARAVE|nr:FMRFamide-activated amiloride-sensitive sodium channel [Araneus ventricosus]
MMECEIDSKNERRRFKEENASRDLEISNGRKWNCHSFCNILSGNSSVQAVSRVAQAETKSRKIFWLAVFLVCLCGCTYQVNSFLSIFFQYPVLIDVEVKNNEILKFPAVTVCNLNRMKRSYVRCVNANKSWSECMSVQLYPISFKRNRVIFLTERKLMTSISKTATQLQKEYKLKSQVFLNHYTNLDEISRKCYGYSLHELVKHCTFNSAACVASDFSYFQSKQYGNCFTFNKKTEVNKIGPDFGLELDLDVQLNTYMDISQNAGLRIVIHDSDEDPNPAEDGINISPGYETQISLTKTSSQRLPAPYRDRCKIYQIANDSYHRDDSQFNCIRQCMQQTNLEMCGCINPFLPTNPQVNRCNLKNTTQMFCLDGVLEYLSEYGLPCECPLPCMSSSYDLRISTSSLQSTRINWSNSSLGQTDDTDCDVSSFVDFVPGVRRRSTVSRGKRNSDTSAKLESRAKLKVFYGSLDHTIYAQRAMFSDSELYGHLGGHLGLWLGLSLIAVFECAEYLLLLSNLILKKRVLPIN